MKIKSVEEAEKSCGNGVKIDFEVLDTTWIQTQDKPTYHGWPTVANVGNDKLVIVCSGDRECHIDPFGKVLMYESIDRGKSWSLPKILANGPLDDRDAGITVTPDGSWLVNYFTSLAFALTVKKDDIPQSWKEAEDRINISTLREEHGFFMLRSTDQGRTWSPKVRIGVNNVHGAIVLADGTLFYCGRAASSNWLGSAMFADGIVCMRSCDDGITWEEISRFSGEFEGHPLDKWDELHSVQAADGTIITHIRYTNTIWQMSSKDFGKTWHDLHQLCGGLPSHLLKLSDGRLLMSYGNRLEDFGNRCRLSSDNGRSWSEPMIISRGAPSNDLGYPSTAELSDGTLVTVWYEFRPDIRVASLRCAVWKLN